MRIGIVGRRGSAHASGFRSEPDCQIAAVCDADPSALHAMGDELGVEKRFTRFAELLDHVDAVLIATPMHQHAPQTVAALQAGKHVMSEVTAAISMEELWQIWDAVQASGKTYLFAENYCYFRQNLLVRQLVREGLFGRLSYGEGEYVHDVKFLHHFPDGSPTWRYYHQVGKPGSTYGTHALGPVMQWMKEQDANDRVETVVCLGSGVWTDPEHPHDDTSVSLCKLASGRLIRTRLDMMSNRPNGPAYYTLQGTTGAYEAPRHHGEPHRIWLGENPPSGYVRHQDHTWRDLFDYEDHLDAKIRETHERLKGSGHGGGDSMVAVDFVRTVRGEIGNLIPAEDGLHWTAVDLCSSLSLANGGVPIRVPNFVAGADRPLYVPPADLSAVQ